MVLLARFKTNSLRAMTWKSITKYLHNHVFLHSQFECDMSVAGLEPGSVGSMGSNQPRPNWWSTNAFYVKDNQGLVVQGHLLLAIEFMFQHPDCFYDVILLSSVSTVSQFFISYTIRTFGALTFATIMTTRQLLSILLSCVWFAHPLSWVQYFGAAIVFGVLYTDSLVRTKEQKPEEPKLGPSDPEEGVRLTTMVNSKS